jgi:RNA polymerase sigma-70 factor (ECF subfamily)
VKLDIDQISNEYLERIHRAALVLTGNPWDADDLTQETFLVLSRQASTFQGKSKVFTWLYGILINLERRERRRYLTRQKGLKIVTERHESEAKSEPATKYTLEVSEWKKSLWAQVAKLSDGQRLALVLRFSEEMSYEEIAETLACPIGTVKSRLFNGLANLRELMHESQDIEFFTTDPPLEAQRRSARS